MGAREGVEGTLYTTILFQKLKTTVILLFGWILLFLSKNASVL